MPLQAGPYIGDITFRKQLALGETVQTVRDTTDIVLLPTELPIQLPLDFDSEASRAAEGWLNLTETAKLVGVSARTLRLAVELGELQAERPLPDGPWIFRCDQLTTNAARAIAARASRRS